MHHTRKDFEVSRRCNQTSNHKGPIGCFKPEGWQQEGKDRSRAGNPNGQVNAFIENRLFIDFKIGFK